jgi:hypothetical protein
VRTARLCALGSLQVVGSCETGAPSEASEGERREPSDENTGVSSAIGTDVVA